MGGGGAGGVVVGGGCAECGRAMGRGGGASVSTRGEAETGDANRTCFDGRRAIISTTIPTITIAPTNHSGMPTTFLCSACVWGRGREPCASCAPCEEEGGWAVLRGEGGNAWTEEGFDAWMEEGVASAGSAEADGGGGAGGGASGAEGEGGGSGRAGIPVRGSSSFRAARADAYGRCIRELWI